MYIKKMMDIIVEKGNKEQMDKLGNMFVDMVYDLKEKDPMKFKSIEYEMHKIAYGDHLTEWQAKCWVSSMENKDGTKGEHWTYEQTEDVRKQYAPGLHHCDWYAVLNMIYSDYYNTKFDTATYIQLAKDWLDDKDIGSCKALKYYLFVVK